MEISGARAQSKNLGFGSTQFWATLDTPTQFLICVSMPEIRYVNAGEESGTKGRGSIGRALVSKTSGWGFESLRPCTGRNLGSPTGTTKGRQ